MRLNRGFALEAGISYNTKADYEQISSGKTEKEIKSWSENVLNQMRKKIDIRNDEIIFLAGEKYRKYLIPHLKNYSIPLKGLGIGKQLSYLKKEISK